MKQGHNSVPMIAFCGIDGAGKTTLIKRLCEQPRLLPYQPMRKENRENVDRLMRLYPKAAQNPAHYLSGPFAAQLRWAYLLDFLWFYEHGIMQTMSTGTPLLLDRWFPCVLAWANMVPGIDVNAFFEIYEKIPSPAATIYLDVPPVTARRRIELRGVAKPDEDIAILRALHESYLSVFDRFSLSVQIIDAEDLDDAYSVAAGIVERAVGGKR
jgi:thymidylate kinase